MRKGFIVISIFIFALSQAGCWGKRPAQANANTENAEVKETPLPEFTDANEALTVGTKLFDDGKTELAIEAFNQAVKLDPDLAEAYFKLGIAYALVETAQKNTASPMETGDQPEEEPANKKEEPKTNSEKAFLKAVAAYKKIIAKDPKNDVAYYNMGRAYNKLNQDDDSEDALRQAVKLKPDDTEYQTELGAILVKLAKYGEAVGALKKAIDLDPDNLTAQDILDDAEAGVKRVGYAGPPKKDDKKPGPGGSPSPSPDGTPDGTAPLPPPPTPGGKDVKPVNPPPTPVKNEPRPKPKPH